MATAPALVVPLPALARFAAKCDFDAATGCVIWTGGKSSGQGNKGTYGVFKYEGRRWFAHRWASHFIHGHAIDGMQVDHCCTDHGAPFNNTLCVQHLQPLTLIDNVAKRWGRRLWGWDEWQEPERPEVEPGVPFLLPPDWLRPFLSSDESPF